MKKAFSLALAFVLSTGAIEARDWFVNNETGNDEGDGSESAPFHTAQIAVNRSAPGDRIVLLPANSVYRQMISLANGVENLILEGNGVTLSGADPLDDAEWEELGDDLHRTRLPKTRYDRHILVRGETTERMQRGTNGKPDFPAAGDLKPGQFRWDDADEETGWLTVKGDTAGLEWSTRVNGIQTSGKVRNVKVFNLSAQHVLNDGFNIHGDARGMQFFNIVGKNNFDEGFSAHDTCQCWIVDGRFFGNENGIADVNEADTFYRNCEFYDNISVDVLFHGGRHGLTDCDIRTREGVTAILIREGGSTRVKGETTPAHLVMRNVSLTDGARVNFGPGSEISYDDPTGKKLGLADVSRDADSVVIEKLHRVFPIGRTSTGEPIMAFAAGTIGPRSRDTYRVIHFGKHLPNETTADLSPNNDWFGLMEPLPEATFPPTGDAFAPEHAAAHAIWRWIGLSAPDAVFVPDTPVGNSLGEALQNHPVAEVGMVSVFLSKNAESELNVLPPSVEDPNLARDEMTARLARTPNELTDQLLENYGKNFTGSYTQALSVIAALENGADVADLAKKYLEDASLPSNPGDIAGTLLYAHLSEPWASERVIEVAQSLAFDENGKPVSVVKPHQEMSDSVFMICPLLTEAGRLSGDERYFDVCLSHLRFMKEICLRGDSIYRHSPLNDAAWGRGNGFPAFGLSLVLEHFPEDHAGREEILTSYRDHLSALAKHQDADGMWHQIIDHHDSYAEFTATAMIASAIARGIRFGWLEQSDWSTSLTKAWEAIQARIGTDGTTLFNVCTGTGKQKTLEDYYLRKAILGRDDRGGAMALMLASEMAKWYKATTNTQTH